MGGLLPRSNHVGSTLLAKCLVPPSKKWADALTTSQRLGNADWCRQVEQAVAD